MEMMGMESRLQAVQARVQEIEARLGGMANAPAPPASTAPPVAPNSPALAAALQGGDAANQPFNVMLAQAGGGVKLQPMGGAGPFAPNIEALVSKYAAQNGLAPELVRAVIQQESGGNPRSRSAVGAQGLMQLMPETAAGYGVQDAFDPEQNIAAGTRHLSGLMHEFGGDVPRALAAYNAGSGAVRKYNGVPPFAETQQYVQRIMKLMGQ